MVKSVGNEVHEEPEDVHIPSSPFMSSSMPNQDVEEQASSRKVMTLVREEHLDGIPPAISAIPPLGKAKIAYVFPNQW